MSLHYLVKYEAEKWHHSEIHIAINDESQVSIAKNLTCDELLYYTFIIHSAGEIIVKFGEHFGETGSQAGNLRSRPGEKHS